MFPLISRYNIVTVDATVILVGFAEPIFTGDEGDLLQINFTTEIVQANGNIANIPSAVNITYSAAENTAAPGQ